MAMMKIRVTLLFVGLVLVHISTAYGKLLNSIGIINEEQPHIPGCY